MYDFGKTFNLSVPQFPHVKKGLKYGFAEKLKLVSEWKVLRTGSDTTKLTITTALHYQSNYHPKIFPEQKDLSQHRETRVQMFKMILQIKHCF